MQSPPLIPAMSRLFALAGIVIGLLLLAGGGRVAADGDEPPVGVVAFPNAPGAITVTWTHTGDGVYWFVIEQESPFAFVTADADKRAWTITGLAPDTTYRYRVCAVYDFNRVCSDEDGVGYVSVRTLPPERTGDSNRPPAPWIVGHEAGETWVRICWLADYDYDSYFVNNEEKGVPGTLQTIDHENGGKQGCQRIDDLQPGRTYILGVQGCSVTFFGVGGDACYDWSAGYEATTLRRANFIDELAPPAITSTESGETWIFLTWNTTPATPDHNYDHFNVKYYVKPADGAPPALPTTEAEDGATFNHTAYNLQPSTTYVFSVQGCDLNLGLNGPPSVDCGSWSPEREETTKSPLPASGFFVPAELIPAQSAVTAGNTLKLDGRSFPPNSGTVTLTLDSGTPLGTATVSAVGMFEATVTIPADTTAGTHTIHAVSGDATADVSVQVTAASGGTGTLVLTYSSFGETGCPTTPQGDQGVLTEESFHLFGAGFAPGTLTIHVDSATGLSLGTATVGADGTFCQEFQGPPTTPTYLLGDHTLVAVQNDTVQASIPVTFIPHEVIH